MQEQQEPHTILDDPGALEKRLARLHKVSVEPYSSPEAEKALEVLAEATHGLSEDSIILYPGSAADITCARVFGANVIHIDPDSESIAALTAFGLAGVPTTFEEYLETLPEGVSIDLIYSHNAGLVPEDAIEKLRPGGYIIANNWHGSANHLASNDDLELVSAVTPGSINTMSAEQARAGLGVETIVVKPTGIVTDPEIIANPGDDCTVIKQERNPGAQWLFAKKAALKP